MSDNISISQTQEITTHDLTIGYRHGRTTTIVASGINESIPSGELTCLLGPNGAGKTTLMRTLSGFIHPVSGEVYLQGQAVGEYTRKELACRLAVVLTERPQTEHLTVAELTAIGRSPHTGFFGRLEKSDNEIIEHAMRVADIIELRDRKVATLSDGERQKAMIAKAIAQQTEIIILDEPTAFLDYPSKVETMLLLRRLCEEENKTIFLSTHDLEIALQTSDRIWLMSKEEGLKTGTPLSLSEDGSISRYFHSPGLSYDAATRRFLISM